MADGVVTWQERLDVEGRAVRRRWPRLNARAITFEELAQRRMQAAAQVLIEDLRHDRSRIA